MSPLSVSPTATVTVPKALGAGVKVRVPSGDTAGAAENRALLVVPAVKVRVWAASSAGPAERLVAQLAKEKGPEFSLTVTLEPLVKVGGSFTGFTVRTNSSKALRPGSLAVMRMVAVPDWLAAGVTVTARFASEPPRTMLATGTRVVFDDVLASVRPAAGVSASPMVKATAPVETSSLTVRLAMSEMVGRTLLPTS